MNIETLKIDLAKKLFETNEKSILEQIKNIFDFHSKKSTFYAKNVSNLIFDSAESIVFVNQYQVDEFNPQGKLTL